MTLKNAFENLAVESKQLPDNHNVTVSNAVAVTGTQTDALTDAELRATPVDVNVASSARPTWQTIFEYNIPPNGSLPSGSLATIHPVLNTEPNLVDSGWIRAGVDDGAVEIEKWANQRLVVGGDVPLVAFVMNANDTSGTGIRNNTVPFLTTEAGEVRSIGARFFGKYFRIVVQNVSGSTLTDVNINSQGGTADSSGLTLSLDQPLFDQVPALVVRSVGAGKVPDGLYDNARLGGTVTLSPAPSVLGISGVYTSDPIDTERYPTLLMLIGADQPSADQGIEIQWSETEAFTTVRSRKVATFRTGNITDGLLIPERTRARYLRIKYTNGLTAQGRFFLNIQLDVTPLAQEVDLKSMTAGQTSQQDVTLTATKIATSVLPGRRALRLKNLSSSAHPVFYGFNLGVTTLTGDELAVGESVDMDIDEFVEVYVITTSTGGGGDRVSWTQIGND